MTRKIYRGIAVGAVGVAIGCGAMDDERERSAEHVESDGQEVLNGTLVTTPVGVERAIVRINGCTGTLLRPTWVITARHCTVNAEGAPFASTVTHDALGSQTVAAGNVVLHPDPMIDIALVRLDTAINSGQASVSLFAGQDAAIVGQNVQNYGYGLRDVAPASTGCTTKNDCAAGWACNPVDGFCWRPSGGVQCNTVNSCTRNDVCTGDRLCIDGHCCDISSALRTASLPVSHVFRNAQMHGNNLYDHKYLHIGNNAQNPPQGTLPGDSGGPNFLGTALAGITGGHTPKVYAREFRDWVNRIISPISSGTLGNAKIHEGFAFTSEVPMTGDFNNDGRADLITFVRDSATGAGRGDVYVSLANSNGTYGAGVKWHDFFSVAAEVPAVGDFDGDARDDIVTFEQDTGRVWIGRSNGTNAFGQGQLWHSAFSFLGETPMVGDFNGDGRDDVVTFVHHQNWGDVWVSLSCGTSATGPFPTGCSAPNTFGTRILWHTQFSLLNEIPRVGDFNGDNLDDLATFATNGDVHVALSQRKSCATDPECGAETCWNHFGYCPGSGGVGGGFRIRWATSFSLSGATPRVGDMNGDGLDDIVSFETTAIRGRNGAVDVALSTGATFQAKSVWSSSFCLANQVCAIGDSNANGRDDGFRFLRSSVSGASAGDVFVGLL